MSTVPKLRRPNLNIPQISNIFLFTCYLFVLCVSLIGGEGSWGSYLNNKLIDHDQADHHGDVGQQGEDGQDPEIPDKNQQHQEGQEGEHVKS